MTKSMFGKIIYQKRWWIFWWFLAAALTAFATTIFFPDFKGTNISHVFNSLPASVQHITGSGKSFDSLSGYIGNEVFGLRGPLITIILGIIVFNSLTVGEEKRGILETHVGLPLTRSKILFSKLLAGLVVIILASIGLYVGVIVALAMIHDSYSSVKILQLVAECASLGVVFGLVVVALNSIFGIRGIVLGLTCAYAFLAYMATTLVVSVHSLRIVEKASLFHYYPTTGQFSSGNLEVMGYISLILIIISFVFFTRRDIET